MFKFFPFSGEAEVGEVKNDTGSFIHISRERERKHQEVPRDSLQLTKKLMATEMLLPDLRDSIMSSTEMLLG
jgi:hypothetical protein